MGKKYSNSKIHLKCEQGCDSNQIALGICRACYKRQYRLKNIIKVKTQERASFWRNREKSLAASKNYKYSPRGRFGYMIFDAKKRGLTCTLSEEQYYLLLKFNCYYCEKPMPKSMGTGLDRIDNAKGYDPDNVLTCCGDCNLLRMHKLTVEETKLLAATLRHFRENKNV